MIIGLVNLDSVINTYQTSVLSITCGSPTDAISDWTLILCAGVLSRCLASWLLHLCTVTHSVRQPGFDLSQWQWSLLHHFHTAQGHCDVCQKRWWQVDSDLCACGEPQTMSHIVDFCPLSKLAGGLSKLHSADDDAVTWLTNYGGPQRMHTTTTASHSVHFWCGNCKYLFVGEQKWC